MQFAMCNEHYDRPLSETFDRLAALGYDGVEVTPWTFTDSVRTVDDGETAAVRKAAASAGLDVVGIPRVFRAGDDEHIGSPDPAVRDRTVDALRATVECCAAIGGDIVVFGSPNQRSVPEGVDEAVAWEHAVASFSDPDLLETLRETGVTLCMEPLSPPHTDFVTTADEAIAFAEAVDHPNVGVCLDGYHLAAEADPIPDVLRRAAPHLAHFHADNTEGRGPRHGTVDYGPIVETLRAVDYEGYVSLEVHADILGDEPFTLDTDEIARDSIAFLRETFGADGSRPKV
ncbi:sugar phosphate isomerase/epimerase family protein [Haloglomus litoreum]|uniref:sugar phosphate isomerase/epimerase family protein n=1 Tax=Haloglomus litoreum TaxID=3034026 RepID=UPI0023E77B74|nr:sugar phosphate isomerase/epimerase family protein [Haloglomus sp. DT116]